MRKTAATAKIELAPSITLSTREKYQLRPPAVMLTHGERVAKTIIVMSIAVFVDTGTVN